MGPRKKRAAWDVIGRTLWVGSSLALFACSSSTVETGGAGSGGALGSGGTVGVAGADPCPVMSPDDPPLSPGPYDHTLHRRSSVDGHAFGAASAPMVVHGSAPDAITGPGGVPWVYFVNGTPGQHAIFVAREATAGAPWEVFDCARFDGEVDATAVDPDVVVLPDGRFRLFYNPLLPANPTSPNPIVSGVSNDGIHFEREGSVIELPGVVNPSAVRLGDGSWLLALASEQKTYLASSIDGVTFGVVQEHPAGIPELAYDAALNEVRLYIAGPSGLDLQTSTDGGATWTGWGTVQQGVQDPSLLHTTDGLWGLYYRTDAAAP